MATGPHKINVYLTGADEYGWALAEDYNQTKLAIDPICAISPLKSAQIIHTVYWEALKKIPTEQLSGKKVICNLSGEWERYEKDFKEDFLMVTHKVDMWVVRSNKALYELKGKGLKAFHIPYTVDTETFHMLQDKEKVAWRQKFKIPENIYLIGNFMRDSSARKLTEPKFVKGPDIFADIAKGLHDDRQPIHVFLAGPRRHWLRKKLDEYGVPYTYAGYKLWFDDMRINTLSRRKLNSFYNMLDLSLVTSRSEAGPHAILEAGAAKCPQLSTDVGIASDILPENQIYDNVGQAIDRIKKDIQTRFLKEGNNSIYNAIINHHTWKTARSAYQALYKKTLAC